MLLAPKKGFVFLAAPKTGTTAIEQAFRPYSQVVLREQGFKHTNYAQFQRFLEPFLDSKGFPRDSYEVVCTFREPIDWLFSWWRYRSRKQLANASHSKHRRYTGHISFEQFARAYMAGDRSFAKVGRLSRFVRPQPGQPEVDHIFRYERLDLLIDFLSEKVGNKVKIRSANVSPKRPFSLSEECERDLREFFAPEYSIFEKAIGGRKSYGRMVELGSEDRKLRGDP